MLIRLPRGPPIKTATEGPCTEAADRTRKDVSEEYGGLPLRLALRVVDAACEPVAGAPVKISHTQVTGSHSGDTPNDGMCLRSAADPAKHYFRGLATAPRGAGDMLARAGSPVAHSAARGPPSRASRAP